MLRQYVELLSYRALAELKRDSAGMYLGIMWWILEPILYMLVFFVIFGLGLKQGGLDFVFYLLCGLVPWKWLDSTVRTSSGIILGSAGLMRQVYFPKWLMPGYIILANVYKFFIVFSLLIIFLLISGIVPTMFWSAIPLLILVQFFLIVSLSFTVSALVPLIPDLRFAVSYGMTMLFFLSGVFFKASDLGEPVRTWLSWVPTVVLINAYRDVILYGLWPDFEGLIRVFGFTLVMFLIGFGLLIRFDRYYPRVVG
jgi:lipopolysaccharide transport system permease protein